MTATLATDALTCASGVAATSHHVTNFERRPKSPLSRHHPPTGAFFAPIPRDLALQAQRLLPPGYAKHRFIRSRALNSNAFCRLRLKLYCLDILSYGTPLAQTPGAFLRGLIVSSIHSPEAVA